MDLLKPIDIKRMKRDIISYIHKIPTSRTKLKVSEYAAMHRRISTGPRQGPYDPRYTPYLIEIMDNFSVDSIVRRAILLKSVQIGATTAMENVICYNIGENPIDQMYVSGTEDLLKRWVQEKLDPAIDAFGLRKIIKDLNTAGKFKQTGDTIFRKMFEGCSLDMTSARSSSGMSSISKQFLGRDEIDRAPKELTTGEGNFMRVLDGRMQAYGDRGKAFDTSTPTTADSLIYAEYEKGDCRKYYVPCPICGATQELLFGDDYSEFGLKGELDSNNKIIDCYYMCVHCHDKIYEHHKPWMLDLGEWIPTKIEEEEYTRSYSINSLYGPLGMTSWRQILQKWINSKKSKDEEISFTNLYMGMPYIDKGDKISSYDLMSSLSTEIPDYRYEHGTIPNGTIFLTAGIDIQLGSTVNKMNPPRIEMEILGHGRQYKTWSIDYNIFYGDTRDPNAGAFDKLYRYLVDTNMIFKGKMGEEFQIQLLLMDSGDGKYSHTVYAFCKRIKNMYASKGFKEIILRKGEKYLSDKRSAIDKIKFRKQTIGSDNTLIEIATTYYKDILYSRLGKKREDGLIQPPGFCDFPIEYVDQNTGDRRYGDSYFDQLTSETKSEEDASYSAHGKRNEALDCRVMNLCAADVFTDYWVDQARNSMYAKYNGKMTRNQIAEKIRTPFVLQKLEDLLENQRRMLTMNNASSK